MRISYKTSARRLTRTWALRNKTVKLVLAGLYLVQAWPHEKLSELMNAALVSSLPQLLVLVLRRSPLPLKQRTRCWHLLRRARQGHDLTPVEWEELLSFALSGLIRERERRNGYTVDGVIVWHKKLVTR